MARSSSLESAFDAAISETQKSLKSGMTTLSGEDARPQLEKLQLELKDQRNRATQSGVVDREWLKATIRSVIDWAPESELALIAALGRIARAARPSIS